MRNYSNFFGLLAVLCFGFLTVGIFIDATPVWSLMVAIVAGSLFTIGYMGCDRAAENEEFTTKNA